MTFIAIRLKAFNRISKKVISLAYIGFFGLVFSVLGVELLQLPTTGDLGFVVTIVVLVSLVLFLGAITIADLVGLYYFTVAMRFIVRHLRSGMSTEASENGNYTGTIIRPIKPIDYSHNSESIQIRKLNAVAFGRSIQQTFAIILLFVAYFSGVRIYDFILGVPQFREVSENIPIEQQLLLNIVDFFVPGDIAALAKYIGINTIIFIFILLLSIVLLFSVLNNLRKVYQRSLLSQNHSEDEHYTLRGEIKRFIILSRIMSYQLRYGRLRAEYRLVKHEIKQTLILLLILIPLSGLYLILINAQI